MKLKMRLKVALLSIMLFVSVFSYSQNQHKIDSLYSIIHETEKKCPLPCLDDTLIIKAYISLAQQFTDSKQDTAILFYKSAIDISDDLFPLLKNSSDSIVIKEFLAQAYYSVSSIFDDKNDSKNAIKHFNKSIDIFKELDNKLGQALSNNRLGIIYYYQGNYQMSIECYNKTLKLDEELNDSNGVATSYNNIGLVQMYQGDYPQAIESYGKAINLFEILNDKGGLSRSYGYIGIINLYQGDYENALKNTYKKLEIEQKLNNQKEAAIAYINIGLIYYYQTNYKKAIKSFKEALAISIKINANREQGYSLGNLGNVYLTTGRYDKSIEYYNKSLDKLIELRDKRGISNIYLSIGAIYFELGSNEKAVSKFLLALDNFKAMEDKKGIADCYNSIASIYFKAKDYTKSLEYYEKSKIIYIELIDKKAIGKYYINIGAINKELREFKKAIQNYHKALKFSGELEDMYSVAYAYNNLASLHMAISEQNINTKRSYIDSAIFYTNKSLKISKEKSFQKLKTTSYSNLSIIYWDLGKIDKSLKYQNELIKLNNENILLNFSFISENDKEDFFSTVKNDYMIFNSFAIKHKNSKPKIAETVLNNTLRNKGLLLKSSTAMRNAVMNSNDSILIENYNSWIDLRKQIAKLNSEGKDFKNLENKSDSLEAYLVKKSQIFSEFNQVQNINWIDVRESLKENEAVIEFVHFNLFEPDSSIVDFTQSTLYVALVFDKKSTYPEMISLCNEMQLKEIMSKFQDNSYKNVNSIYGQNSKTQSDLYNLIWKPLEANLKDIKTVYVSPSGLLNKVSFSALCNEQNVYLCDNYEINTLSTIAKVYLPENSSINSELNASIYGGINYNTDSTETEIWSYLDGTLTETQIINFFLEEKMIKTNYSVDSDATEEKFKKTSPAYNILHLATHGFFYSSENEEKEVSETDIKSRSGNFGFGVYQFVKNKNPLMRSGLVFARANDVWQKQYSDDNEDGVLTALEVSNIDLRKTQLVVLSACETGLGDIRGTEGVYGLQRAFKMAGAKFLIMSLWEVPDKETKEFMTTFYSKLLNLKDIKQAFNQTQKEMRAKYDPYYWAAFVLIE